MIAPFQEAQGFPALRKRHRSDPLWPLLNPFSHYGYRGAIALAYLGVAVMVFFVLFQTGSWPGAQSAVARARLSQTERAH